MKKGAPPAAPGPMMKKGRPPAAPGPMPIKGGVPAAPGAMNSPVGSPFDSKRRRVRQLHWKAIPKQKLTSNTFWSQLGNIDLDMGDAFKEDGDEIETELIDMFSLSPTKAKGSSQALPATPSKTPRNQTISILDTKRANNAAILLSQFKQYSHTELKDSILSMTKLSVEQLQSLQSLFPLSDSEIKDFKNFNGNVNELSNVDKFFIEMLAIPRLESRFSLFIFKLQFSEQVEHLRKEAQALEACSQQVKQSDQFAKVLKWVHTLGNLLNKDTKFASAGFSLESLPSLAETKAKNNMSFLDCLIKYVEQKNPEIINFSDQLTLLETGTKISLEIMNQHKTELKTTSQQLQRVIKLEKENPFNHPQNRFLDILEPFHETVCTTLEELETQITQAIKTFKELVEYFGDDSAKATPTQFFQNILVFSSNFKRVHREIVQKRERLERTKSRAESMKSLSSSSASLTDSNESLKRQESKTLLNGSGGSDESKKL